MVHEATGHFESAEQAYRQSLAIEVQENNLAGQASTLGQLGNLYQGMGRLEEAATFYRQATEASVRLGDLTGEGRRRSNLANALIKLHRYDEARQELQQAIECKKPYGHAAESWKTWAILEDLERATGSVEEAQAARQQAIETYLAYRRAGAVSQSSVAPLYALVAQAIQDKTEVEARQVLDQVAAKPDTPPIGKILITRLELILAGNRNPALAADSELLFTDAAELQLLLEVLEEDRSEGGPE